MYSNDTTNDIPYGYCKCGCGQRTGIAKRNRPEIGHVKGEPLVYILGHQNFVPVETRFWEKVTPGPFTDCWLWQGIVTVYGYGILSVNSVATPAHRVSWMLHFGPIPNGLFACHHCDVRNCVNPYHLFLGTPADNIHDMIAKGRKAIPRHNPVKGENCPWAKLTTDDVIAIRGLCIQGISQRIIGEQFGVSSGTVSDIACRRTWVHVP